MRFSVEIYRFVVSEAEDRNEKEGKDYEKERGRERAKKLTAGRRDILEKKSESRKRGEGHSTFSR